jgi:type III pantothenate kinase
MLLAFDIGNTETTVGLFAGDRLAAHWRLHSTAQRTPDEWASAFTAHLTQVGHSTEEVRASIVASVAPHITQSLCDGVAAATTRIPVRVDARSKLPIVLDVDEPLTVGADRIVNTLAAAQLFTKDTIVVDFGTATTFDCITVDGSRGGGGGGGGRFIGGVIMPGMRTASDELVRKTAKLPATELSPPTHAIGRRTEDCIRVGVLWGTADAVDGLVRRIKAEWPSKQQPMVVATGGLATLVAPLCKEIESVHADLTLIGLRIAAGALGLKW